MHQSGSYSDDEIDLREIVRILLHNWIVLVALTLLGAAIGLAFSLRQHPVYQATAQILVPLNPLGRTVAGITPDLSSVMLSSQVRQEVAQKTGVAIEALPGAGIAHAGIDIAAVGKTDPQTYNITVQASSGQQAAKIANTWADVALAYVDQSAQLTANQDKAKAAIQDADKALVSYLAQNQLSQLTWADLQMLTGVQVAAISPAPDAPVLPNVSIIQSGVQPLPALTTAQRLQLATLMRSRLDAQTEYDYYRAVALQMQYAGATNAPSIQSYANVPRIPAQPRTRLNVAFGAAVGLALAAAAIYLRAWWQSDSPRSSK